MSKTRHDQHRHAGKSLREQLRPLSAWISNLPASPHAWRDEDVDHINIDRYSKSKLGRLLYKERVIPWTHPVFGRFNSLDNFWYFLRSKTHADSLRSANPLELRRLVRKEGGENPNVKNFMQQVLWAMYYRVKSIEGVYRELKASTLPFDSYRVNEAGVRSRNNVANWIVEGYEEIRRAIKAETEPNFTRIAPLKGELEDLHKPVLEEIMNQPKVDFIHEEPQQEAAPAKPKKKSRNHLRRQREDARDAKIVEELLQSDQKRYTLQEVKEELQPEETIEEPTKPLTTDEVLGVDETPAEPSALVAEVQEPVSEVIDTESSPAPVSQPVVVESEDVNDGGAEEFRETQIEDEPNRVAEAVSEVQEEPFDMSTVVEATSVSDDSAALDDKAYITPVDNNI